MPIETIRWENFPSQFIRPHTIEIWLPPGYQQNPSTRFPVLYMHDGQNLFYKRDAYSRVTWGVVPALMKLVRDGKAREAIIVGIWTNDHRLQELMPEKPFSESARGQAIYQKHQDKIGIIESDNYLKMLVEEVKPAVDQHYRTLTGPENTFVMGSSMGGLISLYAICEYPQVFGGAGCLSTHWPFFKQLIVTYLKNHLPEPATHKFYFDFGTVGLDAEYEPYQIKIDQVLRKGGYQAGVNWITRKFDGAEHHESYWRKRVHIPLKLFLGKEK